MNILVDPYTWVFIGLLNAPRAKKIILMHRKKSFMKMRYGMNLCLRIIVFHTALEAKINTFPVANTVETDINRCFTSLS